MMGEKSPEERVEERAGLLRQGAGNYANLCGVLAGFDAVIMVLISTLGFYPKSGTGVLFELVVLLFAVSAFGYIYTAIFFVNISSTPLWHYESLEDMRKEYAFCQYLVVLFTAVFLGGVTVLNFAMGTLYVGVAVIVGLLLVASELIRSWWALARRPPPKKGK